MDATKAVVDKGNVTDQRSACKHIFPERVGIGGNSYLGIVLHYGVGNGRPGRFEVDRIKTIT